MLFLTNLDQALSNWAEFDSAHDAEGRYTGKALSNEPNDGPHQRAKAAMQDLVLAILTEAERIAQLEVERRVSRRLTPWRAFVGHQLRRLAFLVDEVP